MASDNAPRPKPVLVLSLDGHNGSVSSKLNYFSSKSAVHQQGKYEDTLLVLIVGYLANPNG